MKKLSQGCRAIVRLAALSAVLLALCSKSSPLYAFNDWMDANIFFTMGRSMLGGRVLYRDVFDHKGPVLYLLYGLAGLVGGTDFRGVLVLEIIAMTSFLYTGLRTAELLAGRRLSVWWMALPAAGMAASRAFSHGGSAEELLLPFLAAALFSLVRALHSPGAKRCARSVCRAFWPGARSGSSTRCWASTSRGSWCWRRSTCGAAGLRSWAAAWGRTSAAWRWPRCRGSSTSAYTVRWGLVHRLLL